LTGNPRISAEAKLSIFGLAGLLNSNTGAYGDDNAVRAKLVNIAKQRAQEQTGITFTEETTIIIGDSPSDVEAAMKGGAQIVAVASGNTPASELRSSGATTILKDLADAAAVREAVTRI
jgi:phosphoglycolate phosphatase-like HAD superfamily hydrolase